MNRFLAAVIALASVAGVVPAAPASAAPATPGRAKFVLTSMRAFPRSQFPSGRRILETRTVSLRAGERRIVHGRLTARSVSARPREQQIGVGCAQVGATQKRTVLTSRNHTGPGSAAGAGILTLDAYYLFVAPADGRYRCGLWARSSGDRMTAIPRDTYLTISRADESGAQQWSMRPCDSEGGEVTPDAPVRTSTGCIYLVPRGRGGFPASGSMLTSDRFIADPHARAIEVVTGLQLTTCYRDTKSCAPEAHRYGGRSPHSVSEVHTRLEALQLDVAGRVCATNASPARGRKTTIITARAHHQKITHRLVAPVSRAPGCTGRFLIRVVTRAASGDPVKITELVGIERDRGTGAVDGLPGRACSNAIARNLY